MVSGVDLSRMAALNEVLDDLAPLRAAAEAAPQDGAKAAFISVPASPTVAPNVTAPVAVSGVYTLAPGQILYGASYLDAFDHGSVIEGGLGSTITNKGSIWYLPPADVVGRPQFGIFGLGSVTNTGLIVSKLENGLAYGVLANDSLNNSGRIYAQANYGSAFGVFTDGYAPSFTNSGLIAARGPVGLAYGVTMENGGLLQNLAGGQILAEGVEAVAVYQGRGTVFPDSRPAEIINAGRIEARSTDADRASFGILVEHLAAETMRIVNSGTITADVAIYANSYAFSPPQAGRESVVNEATGIINGLIYLDLGDDSLINRGTINGVVLMGEGADSCDMTGGNVSGYVDMGGGADSYIGSSRGDRVIGGRDNDLLDGRSGNDLLVGGYGDDTLLGKIGNDGLYGEAGADRLETLGGDVAYGGEGDDQIIAGDLTFRLVDGGAGFDTFVLPAGAPVLGLSAALSTGRIKDIERIVLTGAQTLVVNAADILAATGGETELQIDAGATAGVQLLGTWTAGASRVIDGETWNSWSATGGTVLVRSVAPVTVGGAAPPGTQGLGVIATGDLPPQPNGSVGIFLTDETTISDGFEIPGVLHIEAGEIWTSSTGDSAVLRNDALPALLTNDGTITNSGAQVGSTAIFATNLSLLDNNGTVEALTQGAGWATGFFSGAGGRVSNDGLIQALAVAGAANAVTTYQRGFPDTPAVFNQGTLLARSDWGQATGVMLTQGGWLTNHGDIIVQGGPLAVAIDTLLTSDGTYLNTGLIQAETSLEGGRSIGFRLVWATSGTTITNSGEISADVAIESYSNYGASLEVINSGVITGDIVGRETEDGFGGRNILRNTGTVTGDIDFAHSHDNAVWSFNQVYNAGLIIGDITLGIGADLYDGTGGELQGRVYGGSGDDTLIGSLKADRLNGEDGADILRGGKGGDTLSGGDGADSFQFLAADGADIILDFAASEDRISLTAGMTWSLTTLGADTRINLSGGGSVLLKGVSAAQITGANFTTFAPGPQAADDGARHDLTGSASPRGRDGAAPEAAPLVWNGTALNDRYRAGAVDDALNGLAGNDTLDGGFGDDILAGGTGDDVLFGGGGNDTASYEAALAGVTVNLNLIIPQATGGDGTDRLSGIENLLGSAFGDMLIGGDLSNLIEGGQGSDILSGEFGADVIFGGSRSGPADLSSNRLYGGHGQDVLHAGDGGDLLDGGISDDILVAGGGADLFVSADGKDTVVGFDVSEDRLFISAPYVVEAAGSDTLVWIGRDHFLLLDVQADQLTAANFFSEEPYPPTAPEPYILYNPIIGNETDETLTGGALGDHIEGLFGDDLLIGGRGDDWLEGFYGDDILRGDAGADILQGGRGNNILTGGAGADTFRVTYEVGYDTVMDFKVGEDVIDATQYGSFISIQKQGKSSLIVFASDRMMLLKNVSPDKLSYSDFIGLYELRGFEGISGAAQPGVAPATRHDPARLGPDTALHEGHFAPVVAVPAYTALGDGLWMME